MNKKDKFFEYILENFTIDNDGRRLISNILDWIWMQSMDKEDSINCLMLLLDGVGLTEDEISQFINQEYICYISTGTTETYFLALWNDVQKAWEEGMGGCRLLERDLGYKVIAWQPLPEPYQPKGE